MTDESSSRRMKRILYNCQTCHVHMIRSRSVLVFTDVGVIGWRSTTEIICEQRGWEDWNIYHYFYNNGMYELIHIIRRGLVHHFGYIAKSNTKNKTEFYTLIKVLHDLGAVIKMLSVDSWHNCTHKQLVIRCSISKQFRTEIKSFRYTFFYLVV